MKLPPAADSPSSNTAGTPPEPTPAATVQSEPIPISKLPATPPYTAVSSPEAQTPSAETPEKQSEPPVEDPAAMAQDLLSALNEERAAAGAAPLVLDSALSSVAQLRAQECTKQFGHTRPDGSPYRSAVTAAGLSYQHLGEILATGQSSPQSVMQSWENSDGHHDNIVNTDYNKVGIGLAKNTDGKYEGYAWAVVFTD